MKARFSSLGIGALLLGAFTLAALGANARADNPSGAGPVKVQVEVIAATAGDIVNSGVAPQYMPFNVEGNIPANTPEKGSDSLATVRDKAEARLHDYLKVHGKVLYKATLTARDQKPTTILVSEPIKGASTGLEPGGPSWDMQTVGMRFELASPSLLNLPSRELQLSDQVDLPPPPYCLAIDLAGGVKEKDTTVVYVQRLEENITPAEGSFAVGGLASTKAISAKGVPLFTDGLTSDGGFGVADPKAPVLFVFVTPG